MTNAAEPIFRVAVSQEGYDKLLKDCKTKGHSFTYCKNNKKTLVKLFGDDLYEVIKGKKDRMIVAITPNEMKDITPTSHFGVMIKRLIDMGLTPEQFFIPL